MWRVRVLVVDDHPVFLRAARDVIAATPGFEHVADATSGTAAVDLAAAFRPALVLLDSRMRGTDAIETASQLLALDAQLVVLLIGPGPPPVLPPGMLDSGVLRCMGKQQLSPQSMRAIWACRESTHTV